MKIDKNSYGSIALVYSLSAVAAFLILFFCNILAVKLLVLIFLIAFCIWQTAFFRVPVREKAGSDKIVSAVADGSIVIVDKVFEPECLKSECIQVSIYMDFWDVHANFWPMTGEVTYSNYHPGKHFLAFKPKASLENEHTCTCVRNNYGQDVFFKQLAGGFARRIVSYATEGLGTKAGEQCGIIKFGSRIDMFLPVDAKICVNVGDKVRACETVIAEL